MYACPCGSNKSYSECCGLYINGHKKPEVPEELMRARYTAYTQANIDYIIKTMKPPASNNFDEKSAKEWAKNVTWLGLEVLKATTHHCVGYVAFIARFNVQGKKDSIHEYSEFHQINGEWYYVAGKAMQTKPRSKIQMSRNELCFCGSGKKYKKCCMNDQTDQHQE